MHKSELVFFPESLMFSNCCNISLSVVCDSPSFCYQYVLKPVVKNQHRRKVSEHKYVLTSWRQVLLVNLVCMPSIKFGQVLPQIGCVTVATFTFSTTNVTEGVVCIYHIRSLKRC